VVGTVRVAPDLPVGRPDDPTGATCGLGEHPAAASAPEHADLQVRLLVGGGDPGIIKELAHAWVAYLVTPLWN
jgi:hypothetical protein